MGDVLLSLPPVRDFVAQQPGASVGYVVASPLVPLLERVPWIREVHAFDSPRYARSGQTSSERDLLDILERDWDLVIDLSNDRAATWTAFGRPSRFRRDVGTVRAQRRVRKLLGGRGFAEEHVTRVFYRTLGLPIPDPIVPQPIVPRPEDDANATARISRAWPGDRPLAAIHAGATWEYRRWPSVRFAEVARALERSGASVFLVGGPDDREISLRVAETANLAPERVLAGECDLPTTAAVLARMSVVVANDGGVMHLAVAQGARVVGIFGPTSPTLFGPIGARATTLHRPIECSPCAQRHCVWGRARCLEPIEVADVIAAALDADR
jgi:ADP-heptose:LPS heptosyltransferase